MKRITTGLTADEFYARIGQNTVTATDRAPRVPWAVTYRCGSDIYPQRGDWAVACTKRAAPLLKCACRAEEIS